MNKNTLVPGIVPVSCAVRVRMNDKEIVSLEINRFDSFLPFFLVNVHLTKRILSNIVPKYICYFKFDVVVMN